VVVTFDESLAPLFCNGIFTDYQAKRESPPAELSKQFEFCRTLVQTQGRMTAARLLRSSFDQAARYRG
jgi:5'-3' exonuclease